MPAAFNITMIQPEGYSHSQALSEVVRYLCDCIRRCGYLAECTMNHVALDRHNVIVCGHMLAERYFPHLPHNTIIFNSEQLQDESGWHMTSGVYRRLIDNHFVWDYSDRNLSAIVHDWKARVPLYYCAALKRNDLQRTPGDYLLFYGALPKRRKQVLAKLRFAGVKVRALFDVYGDARDAEMFNCWAVLNLHKSDERNVFEPVRCFYPLINRIPVISEPFSWEPLSEVYERSVFVTGAGTLVEDIAALYGDPDRFNSRAEQLVDVFSDTDPLPYVQAALTKYLAFFELGRTADIS